jgi:uncharacterized lipoprotein YmbA
MRTCRFMIIALLLSLLVMSGCLGLGKGTVVSTKMYVLRALDTAERQDAVAGLDALIIGIGPVKMAAYLKRPQIITRVDDNEVRLADFARWAEPLEDGIPKVLAENVSVFLGTEKVLTAPWRMDLDIAYQVLVNVTRFDAQFDGDAVLTVRWGVVNGQRESLFTRMSTYRKPVIGQSYGAVVAAENQVLEDFSRDVAEAIKELVGKENLVIGDR